MTASSTNIRLAVTSALAIALFALLFFAVRSISSKNMETSELVYQAEESSQKEVSNQAIRSLRNASREEIEEFEMLALSGNEVVGVIESLEKAGRALELETEIVSVSQTGEAGTDPQKIKIVIEGKGGWDGAYSLVKAVESLPQRVMLEEASLSKEEALWKAHVEFSLYSFN
jgi:hypothetical protein